MSAAELDARAQRMRRWAANAPAPLAVAYRRRALHLELLAATSNTTEAS